MFEGVICFTVWSTAAASGWEFNMLAGLVGAGLMSDSRIPSVLKRGREGSSFSGTGFPPESFVSIGGYETGCETFMLFVSDFCLSLDCFEFRACAEELFP